MGVKLKECFAKTTLADALREQYNTFGTLVAKPVTEEESVAMLSLIEVGLGQLLDCETMYETIDDGTETLTTYIQIHTFNLVTELRNQIFALSNDMGKQHNQAKFNPIDNENIESGVIATDDLHFNYADNLMTNINFLAQNTKSLRELISTIKRDTLMVL